MLLCYLRDFVTLRYNNILDLTNKYDATVDFNKRVSTGRQKVTYTLSMHDVRRDDPYLKEHNPARDVIDRIDLILKAILAFLATPLMEDVGKAPMLKPPITKTNVLKMNNNFKGAVALYDYIISYDKPGYTVETNVNTISPFRDDLADELAEAGGMVSFLAYEYGLGIKQELRESYNREEDRIKAEKVMQQAERIESLKRRLKASEISPEEYILELEKQLRALEGESARATALAEELFEHKENEKRLEENIVALRSDIEGLKNDIEEEKHRHFEEMEALKAKHEDEIHELILKHEAEMAELAEKHAEAIKLLEEEKEQLRKEAEEAAEAHKSEMDALREEMSNRISEAHRQCADAIGVANREKADAMAELDKKCGEYDELTEKFRLANARIKALGGVDRDYTDRDSFNELESEYNAFTRIYKEQWAKTKKQIRKNHINKENIKG
jgi:hypothetical protein